MTDKVSWKQKDKGEKDQRLKPRERTPVESSKASTSVCGELEEEIVAHLFLAVQDSSIGDLVTQSVSETPFDFRAEQSRALQ